MRKERPLTRDGRIVGACIVLIVVAALGSISIPTAGARAKRCLSKRAEGSVPAADADGG